MTRRAFTGADVARLRYDAQQIRETLQRQGHLPTWDFPADEMESGLRHAEWYEDLANRIEVVLAKR
jgi:hypothetical protein